MAKNTGRGHRVGAVKGRSEFQQEGQWFKRDTASGRILNGSPEQPKSLRNEKWMVSRTGLRRAGRTAAIGAVGPVAGGALLGFLVLAGHPVAGPWHWAVNGLFLTPVLLVHCHQRAERHGLGAVETAILALAAGALAYLLAAIGLIAGAVGAFGIVLAAQTGVLAVVSQLGGLLSVAMTLTAARRPAH